MADQTTRTPLWVTLALGAPAAAGTVAAVLLAVAAWTIDGFGPGGVQDFDPVVRLVNGAGRGFDADAAFSRAARLAPLDHRYPFRLGYRRLFAGRSARSSADVLEAGELFEQAARLAPSDGIIRFYLSQVAVALSRFDLADEQARAASQLGPLNLSLKRRVSRYFADRYRESGRTDDLNMALASVEGDLQKAVAALSDDEGLTYERAAAALRAAKVDPVWAVGALSGAGHLEWAVAFGEECLVGGEVLGRLHADLGKRLLASGDAAGGLRELGEARRLLGGEFGDDVALGEACLRAGETAAGWEALRRALSTGEAPSAVAAAQARAGASASDAVTFWSERARGGGPLVALELGGALVRAGRADEASGVLRGLLDLPETAARANYLMARMLVDLGSAPRAVRYAREAALRDPGCAEYRTLLREIGE